MTTTEKTTPRVSTYSMKVPLLTSGRTNQVLARTDTVEVRAKVQVARTPCTPTSTRTTRSSSSTARPPSTARTSRPSSSAATRIMIPAGAFYRFQSTGDTNLVLLRFGADVEAPEGAVAPRIGPDGLPLAGKDPRNKQVPPVLSGATFGEA